MALNYRDIVHPEDEKALRQLQNTPGVKLIAEKIVNMGYEKFYRNLYMADHVRLGPDQLPEVYNLLPPIAEKLGIEVPELYIQQQPVPNAWTVGDKHPLIVLYSGLITAMTKEELASVLAHECGHILCHHCLYKTVLSLLQSLAVMGGIGLGVDTLLSKPLILAALYASCYWSRRSEYSADRVALIYTEDIELNKSALLRLAAGPRSVSENINLERFAEQTQMQDDQVANSMWDKILYTILVSEKTHPFMTTRLAELNAWGKSAQYRMVLDGMKNKSLVSSGAKCPGCGAEIEDAWKFCRHCGYQLK